MAIASTFDYIKRLEQAGYSHQAAEAHIEVLTALTQDITMQSVTKIELDNLDKDIKHQIEKSESRLEHKIDKLDFRVSSLAARVDSLSANMKWGIGIALTYLTALITFVQFFKH